MPPDSTVIRTYRYRLYPNKTQAAALTAQLSEACRLYNAALQERRDAWRLGRHRVNFYDQDAQLKLIRAASDIAIPNFSVARDVLRRVDRAYQAFFRRVRAGQTPGYPRFRSRRRYDSLTWMGVARVQGERVRLHGVGDVRLRLHRALPDARRTVTVRHQAGRWYVMFVCAVAPQPLPPSTAAVGIDVGLAAFATLSDGTQVANPRHERSAARRLRIAQRRVARRKKGSAGRRKAVTLLQRAHAHVQDGRRDFHHKVSRALVNRYGLIAVEDLNIKGLARGMLARSVHDAGWAQFLSLLAYKAEDAGRQLALVNPAGTTQQCSGCGEHVPKGLSERRHDCPACGLDIGRDLNAARNILGRGRRLVAETWPAGACVATAGSHGPTTRVG